MKKSDVLFLIGAGLFFSPFFLSETLYQGYLTFNSNHPLVMSFVKFGILATLGEIIGLRIRSGNYLQKGFGILPRAVVWGVLGLTIKLSFVIFATGMPVFMEKMGVNGAGNAMLEALSLKKVLVAFGISSTLNLFYAPVMMTMHRITDTHIINNGGQLSALIKPIDFAGIFSGMDWYTQWHFVFKKTIPFFWIPAHTVTFLLPADFRVLFAAVLGIVLGILLAIASLQKR
ncbi:hypothetical protein DMA11_03515 [Marinilabiliaceae bacterium JC017]|nr:hypothetical protein DMA11_03515 [Marinilabiliaceae bacterium JC017]